MKSGGRETFREPGGIVRAIFMVLRKVYPRGDDGGTLIEMALTLPLLCSLLFCFMELCLASYSWEMISESARQGTRYAAYRGSSCMNSSNASCTVTASQVNSFIYGLGWPNLGGGTMSVSTTFPNGNEATGSLVQVTVQYSFPITMPLVPRNALNMTTSSKMSIVH